MYCLDTYVLWEIQYGNEKFLQFPADKTIITEWTLIEFYRGLLKAYNQLTADYWLRKLQPLVLKVELDILLKGALFQHENKKTDISLFDAIGYVYAQENDLLFVTGDKEFKGRKGVMFIQK